MYSYCNINYTYIKKKKKKRTRCLTWIKAVCIQKQNKTKNNGILLSNSYQISSFLFLCNKTSIVGPFDSLLIHFSMESSWKIDINDRYEFMWLILIFTLILECSYIGKKLFFIIIWVNLDGFLKVISNFLIPKVFLEDSNSIMQQSNTGTTVTNLKNQWSLSLSAICWLSWLSIRLLCSQARGFKCLPDQHSGPF